MLSAQALAAQQKPDDIPDAPSATRPIPPPEAAQPAAEAWMTRIFRSAPPADNSEACIEELPNELAAQRSRFDGNRHAAPPPMPPVKTVPAGSVPKDVETGEDVATPFKNDVNLVLVPVTVTDADGRLVGGLQPKDFYVLENGQRRSLKFFTSDPFALSAAVIIDTGMPDVGLKKVQETLSALQGPSASSMKSRFIPTAARWAG